MGEKESQERWRLINRLAAVGGGTMLWVGTLKLLVPGFTMGYALLLAIWISTGSPHYAQTLSDFERPVKPGTLLGLAMLSPAWPILYWQLKRGESDEE